MRSNPWPVDFDGQQRHRSHGFQAELLEQKPRPGGGYYVKVRLPGGYELDKIPLKAGHVYVGKGESHTAWLEHRNGDKNKFEATHVSADPKHEHIPETPTGFHQNPANKKQYSSVDKDGIHHETDGKPVTWNSKFTLSAKGVLKGPGCELDLTTGILKGAALSVNVKTGEIIGNILLKGSLKATGTVTASNIA
jgi:hypothetical protein